MGREARRSFFVQNPLVVEYFLYICTINIITMEKLIRKKCKEVGITPDILTPEELEELKEEIKAEQQGLFILDGVLFNPEIYTRKYKK